MATTEERIRIVVETHTQQIKRIRQEIKAIRIEELANKFNTFGKVLRMPLEQLQFMNKEGGKFNTVSARTANRLRLMTHGMKGFRMEMLGVMFFGMMLTRTLTGLLRPAMEAFGIFDLWGIMLQILFLPIMIKLFPYFMKLIKFLIELDPELQLIVGALTVFGIIIGGIFTFVGQFALGIGSIILVLGPMGAGLYKAGGAMTFFKGLFLGIGPIFAIVVAGLLWFVALWKTNFGGFKDFVTETLGIVWETFKSIIGSIKDLFQGLVTFISGAFKGDWNKAWDGIIQALKAVSAIILKLLMVLGAAIINVFIFVWNYAVIDANRLLIGGIVSLVKALIHLFLFLGKKIQELMEKPLTSLVNKINSVIDSLASQKGFGFLKKFKIDMSKQISFDDVIKESDKFFDGINDGINKFADKLKPGFITKDAVKLGLDKVNEKLGLKQDDFISRPGQAPVPFNPNDTIVGFKGNAPFGGGQTINITNNITGNGDESIMKIIDEAMGKLVDELRRISPTGG